MSSFKKILVALDFSDMDESILSYLENVIPYFSPQEVHFMHVLRRPELPRDVQIQEMLLEHLPGISVKDFETHVRKSFRNQHKRKVKFIVTEGKPFFAIMDYRDEISADLIITGRKKISSGSGLVAKRIARKAKCSVLFVPENASPGIQKILIPIDFSEFSQITFDVLLEIYPKLTDPKIIVQHVYDVPVGISLQVERTEEQFARMIKLNVSDALDDYLKNYPLKKPGLRKVLSENHSNPAKMIDNLAKECKADLIMMGSKGKGSAMEAFFIGSVTEKLLIYNEDIPMLIVRKLGK